MKVKEEGEKAGLKLNIQKMKIMASGPIASWKIDGETMKTVTDFTFLGSKITADSDCSHEIKIPSCKALSRIFPGIFKHLRPAVQAQGTVRGGFVTSFRGRTCDRYPSRLHR